jgi:hypothetical protein
MSRNLIAVSGAAVLLGLTLACTSNSSTPLTPTTPSANGTSSAAADGSTLKVSAPVPVSPVGGGKPATGPATLVITPSTATFSSAALPNQYRFQVLSGTTVVDNALVSATSYSVNAELVTNQAYTWRARAELNGYVGPWSTSAAFVAPESAFLGAQTFADPLTTGKTVGAQHGGQFIAGQGWQSLSETDGIDYDLSTPCADCSLTFDITNIGPQEGLPSMKDYKFVSMGDASSFGSFGAFRDNPWKMHFIQRADFPSGLEIVWRNGGTDPDGGDPGDHRIKLNDTPIVFISTSVNHAQLDWGPTGYTIAMNGIQVLADGWGLPYAPPNMRVSLGCYPRGESFVGAIYRNIKLTKH